MINQLRKAIITKHLDIVEEAFKQGNYVDTDFRHYSELVRTLVDTIKELDNNNKENSRIFFTGLCLPLFQWFNFNVDPSSVEDLTNVRIMQCDPIWVEYLKFVKDELKKLNLHRCILCAGVGVKIDEKFKLIPSNVHDKQKTYKIIYKENDPLEPLQNGEITSILNNLNAACACYSNAAMAYLIVDSNTSNVPRGYKIEPIQSFFMSQFHDTGHIHIHSFDESAYKAWVINQNMPEDFFIVGRGDLKNHHEWELALAADVIDFEKVRLWCMAKDMDALEKKTDKNYKARFTFTNLTQFVDYIINGMKQL